MYQKLLKNTNFKDEKSTINFRSINDERISGNLQSIDSSPLKYFGNETSKEMDSFNSNEISKIVKSIKKDKSRDEANTISSDLPACDLDIIKAPSEKKKVIIVDGLYPIELSTFSKTFSPKKELSPCQKTFKSQKFQSNNSAVSGNINSFSTSRNSKNEHINKNLPLSQTNLMLSTKTIIQPTNANPAQLRHNKSYGNVLKPNNNMVNIKEEVKFNTKIISNKSSEINFFKKSFDAKKSISNENNFQKNNDNTSIIDTIKQKTCLRKSLEKNLNRPISIKYPKNKI